MLPGNNPIVRPRTEGVDSSRMGKGTASVVPPRACKRWALAPGDLRSGDTSDMAVSAFGIDFSSSSSSSSLFLVAGFISIRGPSPASRMRSEVNSVPAWRGFLSRQCRRVAQWLSPAPCARPPAGNRSRSTARVYLSRRNSVKPIAMRSRNALIPRRKRQEDAVAGRDIFLRRFGRLAQAQNACSAILLWIANHFRNSPAGGSSMMSICHSRSWAVRSLGQKQICERVRLDGRTPCLIAYHAHLGEIPGTVMLRPAAQAEWAIQ